MFSSNRGKKFQAVVLLLLSMVIHASCAGVGTPNRERNTGPHGDADSDTFSPNILFIYPDQLRRHAMGFWGKPEYQSALGTVGDPVVTPNIDKLADEGIVFSRAVSTFPLCSPYRAMLLSGMYPEKNGVDNNCKTARADHLNPDAECITDVLSDQGYDTAYVGKAHWIRPVPHFDAVGNYLGTHTEPGGNYINSYDTYIPPGKDRHSIGYWFQSIKDDHNHPMCYSSDPTFVDGRGDGKPHRPEEFSVKYEADVIVDYINVTDGQRDPKKPFCLLWSINPPHSPYQSIGHVEPEIYEKYYQNMPIEALQIRDNVTTSVGSANIRFYFSLVTSVDAHVGRVLAALEKAGLKDNTIVVFTADHGEMMGSHGLMAKNVPYEESFGIPLIISYPKKLSHRIDDLFIGSTDMMPTLLGLAGLKGHIPAAVEGTNYAALLRDSDSKAVERPQSTLYIGGSSRGVRTERYTFILDEKNGDVLFLFDNQKDPYQLTNLHLNDIPSADRTFLLTQLGEQLAAANDQWYQKKKFADFVIYPSKSTL